MESLDEDGPAKQAIIEEWDRWAIVHPTDARTAGGMLFFTYLQRTRPDLLVDFKSRGDKWQIVHSWLLSAGKVAD
jgi:hypothetical protein